MTTAEGAPAVGHTPGPWKAIGSNVFADTDRFANRPIAQVGVPLERHDNRIEELEANTRLVAAAPELLAALQLYFANDPRFHKAASDAMAKAGAL